MDGTAIMQGVATVFLANTYGIDLNFADYLSVILVATLASIGTAGVPGVGLIMLTMVLNRWPSSRGNSLNYWNRQNIRYGENGS